MPMPEKETTKNLGKFSAETLSGILPVLMASLGFILIVRMEPSIPNLEKLVSTGEYFMFLVFSLGLVGGFRKISKIENEKEKAAKTNKLVLLSVLSGFLFLVLPFLFRLNPEFVRQPIKIGTELEIPFPASAAFAYTTCFLGIYLGFVSSSIAKRDE